MDSACTEKICHAEAKWSNLGSVQSNPSCSQVVCPAGQAFYSAVDVDLFMTMHAYGTNMAWVYFG